MKKFTKQEIIELYGQVTLGEISFTRMVEIMNERVSEMVNETNEPQFKEGDFVDGLGCVIILHTQIDNYSAKYHVLYEKNNGMLWYDKTYTQFGGIDKLRLATDAGKQELLDALAKEGKRWNEKKKRVEDISVRKFKPGDKVRIKEGVSSKTHGTELPWFNKYMDELIGATMTVDRYTDLCNHVKCEGLCWYFIEDWLEPYVEQPKEGDLAIFWGSEKGCAYIGKYNGLLVNGSPFPHQDHMDRVWSNAIKFESKEQFERLIKGEI